MAQRIDEAKYNEMINALNAFAANVFSASSDMQALATNCVQALGDGDKATGEIYAKVSACQKKYGDAATQARRIAVAMAEELAEQKKEEHVWNGDE